MSGTLITTVISIRMSLEELLPISSKDNKKLRLQSKKLISNWIPL